MPILLEEDLRRPLPKMYRVRQQFDETCLTDIEDTVRRELVKPEICALVKPGMRVAVGVGSRGIQNLSRIVETTVKGLKELGAKPFIVSAKVQPMYDEYKAAWGTEIFDLATSFNK